MLLQVESFVSTPLILAQQCGAGEAAIRFLRQFPLR
jgi:hypothetical protein